MIHLHTLGDALITIGDREIRPTSPMVFAALLYLALERGHRVPRSALQELLFPDSDERSGAHSLRQLLYKLRQLGAPIDADAVSVSLRPENVHDDSDVDGLTNGASSGLERYGHGILPDYVPRISPAFHAWLERKREALLGQVRRKLVAALCSSRETVNWHAVERVARVILELDPFNEEATLALAEATALAGSKARALGMLSRYEVETGRTDLRLPPAILRRRISESLPKTTLRRGTPFVGRESDAEVLRELAGRAMRGRATLAVIVGEAGIGKTRLVEEAANLAALDGARVHVVRCQSHYASRPLGVFIELVPALLTSRGALGVSPQSLAHLKLLISHRDNDRDRPVDARDDTTRSAILRGALRDLADAVSSESPLLIVVEDAHHADHDSLRELSGLTQGSSERALLVVYTTRYLEPLKQSAVLHEGAVVRRLKPLAQPSMEELARHLLQADQTSGEVGEWCVRTAAGNPLFLEMLCARYAETREPYSVPPDLMSAITRRIEMLPRECVEVLELCALLGRHGNIEALRTLMVSEYRDLLATVRRLEDEGYLQLRDDAVRITHDLLTECTLNLIPPLSRKLLHNCVATYLEDRFEATNDAALLWDCSEHWVLSGNNDKAIQSLRLCARHASSIGNSAQSLELLHRARGISQHRPQLTAVLGDMMLVAKSSSQWGLSLALAQEIARLDPNALRDTHSDLELVAIEASWFTGLRAGSEIERLANCVDASDAERQHRLDAACLLLKIAHEKGSADLAHATYRAVAPLLERSLGNYSNCIIPILYHANFGDPEIAKTLGRTLAAALDQITPVASEFRAALNLCTLFTFLGEFQEALALAGKYADRSQTMVLPAWQHDFCTMACTTLVRQERFALALPWHERAASLQFATSRSVVGFVFVANRIELAIWRGDSTAALREIQNALVDTGESLRLKAFLRGAELRALLLDPQYQPDASTLNDLLQLHDQSKRLTCADGLVAGIGEALRRRGDQKQLLMLLQEYLCCDRREGSSAPPSILDLLRQSEPAV